MVPNFAKWILFFELIIHVHPSHHFPPKSSIKACLLHVLSNVWWICERISKSHIVPFMINVIVTGFLPIVKWLALEETFSWGQSMHITIDFTFSLLDTVLIDVQYFSLLRKGLVYSAGNDPNPADICPTGRGALTQVCHFISTVKSIKSTHWGSLFMLVQNLFFWWVFFFFFFFLDEL